MGRFLKTAVDALKVFILFTYFYRFVLLCYDMGESRV